MRGKKQVARRDILECGKTSCLFPEESVDERVDTFDPEASVLNYMTWTIASYAIENRFVPPFRLLFTDANHTSFRESILRTEQDKLFEEIKFEVSGRFKFPLCCGLTDMEGRKHEVVVSPDEMTEWMETAQQHGSQLRFPVSTPTLVPEVYLSLGEMLDACRSEGLKPPFQVEIYDALGELYERFKIADGLLQMEPNSCDWSVAKFPFTIKLTKQSGQVLTTTVQRNRYEKLPSDRGPGTIRR
jgi:hypothetical protein